MLQLKNVGLDGVAGKKTVHILRRINASFLPRGRVLITGPSGSGKSALLGLLALRERPSRGEILADGENVDRWKDERRSAYRRRIAECSEELLLSDRTLLENAELSARLAGWRGGEVRTKAADALGSLGLGDLFGSFPDELSGEERRLAALGCALCRDPEILLVDEPTDGLQESTAGAVLSLLRSEGERRLVVVASRRSELFFGENIRVITMEAGEIDTDTGAGENLDKRSGVTAPGGLGLGSRLTVALGNLRRRGAHVGVRLLSPFAAVLALSLLLAVISGTQLSENALQTETLAAYPITLTGESLASGNLEALADWVESRTDGRGISVHRTYAIVPNIYLADTGRELRQVSPQADTGASLWSELPQGTALREARYALISGRWPQGKDEAVIILNSQGVVDRACASALGLTDEETLRGLSYPELLRLVYRVALPTARYVQNVDGTWGYMGNDREFMAALLSRSLSLKIVGIVRPRENLAGVSGVGGAGYTGELTAYVISSVLDSDIVKAQLETPDRDVVTGLRFDTEGLLTADLSEQLAALSRYAVSISASEQAALYARITGMAVDETAAQDTLLRTLEALSEEETGRLYDELIASDAAAASLEENLRSFGATAAESITAVQIFAGSFAERSSASSLLKTYSENVRFQDNAAGIIDAGAALMETSGRAYLPLRVLCSALAALGIVLGGALPVLSRGREAGVLRCRGISRFSAASVLGWESFLLGALGSLAAGAAAQLLLRLLPAVLPGISAALSLREAGIVVGAGTLLAWLSGVLAARSCLGGTPGELLRRGH